MGYEVMDGNASDKTTLRGFLAKIDGTLVRAAQSDVRFVGKHAEPVRAGEDGVS